MSKFNDLIGKQFGKLTVIKRGEDYVWNDKRYARWLCRCECGNETLVTSSSLKCGKTKSCGCLQREITSQNNVNNLLGKRFGRLIALKRCEDHISKSGIKATMWECQCDCGNIIKVLGNSLTTGKTQSCGCLRVEKLREKILKDLTGQRFGRLVVIKQVENDAKNGVRWLCQCDCGNQCVVLSNTLIKGDTMSCGCKRSEIVHRLKFKDLVGQRFGKLQVIHQAEYRTDLSGIKKVYWHCKCDCGNECDVFSGLLSNGHTQSCGCIKSCGETHIKEYLSKNKIKYESQKTFSDLYGTQNGKLSYDFYLPEYNLLIEYQGKQHEKPIDYFGGKEQLLRQQEHDRRKSEYAEKNGYNLLEIWYYDYNRIEEILQNKLIKEKNK